MRGGIFYRKNSEKCVIGLHGAWKTLAFTGKKDYNRKWYIG